MNDKHPDVIAYREEAKMKSDLAAARQQLEEVKAERDAEKLAGDEARKNYQFMVDRAADEKLDGYRELGLRAATAENERDAAVLRVARLTEALRGIYETKVTRPGGSFGFNIRFNGIYSRELSDLVCLAPAARQGEKEKA